MTLQSSWRIFVRISLCAAILTACSYDQVMQDPDNVDCSTEEYTYNDQIRVIIDRNCSYSGCHDGISGNPGNFTAYEGLAGKITNGLFMSRVLTTRDMPPDNASGPTALAEDELNALTCWIQQGYPEE